MTITREEGKQMLLEAGMTPRIIDNEDTSYFFIEKNICWPKLFCSIKQLPDYREALEVIPHLRLLEKLITNRNPTLFPIDWYEEQEVEEGTLVKDLVIREKQS